MFRAVRLVMLVQTMFWAPVAAGTPWQEPPEPIGTILDASGPPSLTLSPDNAWMVELERPSLPSLAQLAEPVVRVAGLQINPKTRERARTYGYTKMRIRPMGEKNWVAVTLPETSSISQMSWSSDSQYLAFTQTEESGVSLWVLELATGDAKRLTAPVLNQTYGRACTWITPEQGLLCKVRPADEGTVPVEEGLPEGPVIEENLGRATPARTYTNLLQSPHDERVFEYYFRSELQHISLDGAHTSVSETGLYTSASPSPDGQYLLVQQLQRPFSYHVPLSRFPRLIEVWKADGKLVKALADLPLADAIPIAFGSVRKGMRSVGWRTDMGASLTWVEALDEGDARKEVELRDELFQLDAPFDGTPTTLWKSSLRFGGASWGTASLAMVEEWWYDSRTVRSWIIDPSAGETSARLLHERNYQDAYADPGEPIFRRGEFGRSVLFTTSDGDLLFRGKGASPEGVFPFLDRVDPATGEAVRIWAAKDPYYETVVRILNEDATRFVTRRQSKTSVPNYYTRQVGKKRPKRLTAHEDWAPAFDGVRKELITYERADGVQLSATLYLPAGYNAAKDGPLPFLFWAYPREHKSKKTASQITTPTQTFSRPYGSSSMFLLTQGYGLLSGPTMPIVGEGDQEPNDTYREQLVASAQAAVDAVVARGVADPDRIAIGGHSYGAFTTANLLAHTDLFRAGIARSGAYNRTLTPFGFQGEQRTFWEAQDVYMSMSPFTHASKINEPMLMIHGQNDSNSGTYPIQSERLYEAMKGMGATVRWVVLPYEDHGYRSREAIGHTLWEMVRWMDTYVKPAKPTE